MNYSILYNTTIGLIRYDLLRSRLVLLLILSTQFVYSKSAQLTPVVSLGTYIDTVTVPAKFIGVFPGTRTLTVPTNYSVSVYHAGGLIKPRFMAFSPTDILHVSDMSAGKVFALPDTNMDGVADTIIESATGFSGNHDITFYKGNCTYTMAMTTDIKKYDFKSGLSQEFKILDIASTFETQKGILTSTHRTNFYHIIWFQKGNPN